MTPPAPAPWRIQPLDHQRPELAAPLWALRRLAYAQEAALLGATQLPALQQSLAELQALDEAFLGAWVGDELAGALSMAMDDEPGQLVVASLVVHPAHQRRGLGRALMQQALAQLAGRVLAVTTGALNAPALALYRGLGFVDHRQGIIGPEALPVLKLRRVPP